MDEVWTLFFSLSIWTQTECDPYPAFAELRAPEDMFRTMFIERTPSTIKLVLQTGVPLLSPHHPLTNTPPSALLGCRPWWSIFEHYLEHIYTRECANLHSRTLWQPFSVLTKSHNQGWPSVRDSGKHYCCCCGCFCCCSNKLFTHIYSHLSSPAAPAKSQGEGKLFKTLSVDNAATRTRADWPTPASGRARASRMRAN